MRAIALGITASSLTSPLRLFSLNLLTLTRSVSSKSRNAAPTAKGIAHQILLSQGTQKNPFSSWWNAHLQDSPNDGMSFATTNELQVVPTAPIEHFSSARKLVESALGTTMLRSVPWEHLPSAAHWTACALHSEIH